MMTASLLCLAMAVQREAGGEPPPVQVAVAHVIRNRAKARHKPVCKIVKEKSQFFLLQKEPRKEVVKLALKAWAQRDTTQGATHFHDPREYPGWAAKMQRTRQIGKLRFYRKKRQKF